MKTFIIFLSLLFSTQAYSNVSQTELLIAAEEQRLGMILQLSEDCKGRILGFDKALKLILGEKSISNSNRFKAWNKALSDKTFNFTRSAATAYKAKNKKTAYAKASAKARELQTLNCKYWNYLQKASLKEIQSQIK